MAYTKIPNNDAALLVRALGLLVNQAGIYGPTHNVTLSAARSVFAEVERTVKSYGPVEIAVKDKHVLVNGSMDGVDAVSARNLTDRMALHKIGGIVFLAPADMAEFLRCVALFGTPPLTLAAEGGFEEALKKAGLRSIRAVNVAYQRVTENEVVPEAPAAPAVPEKPVAEAPRKRPDPGYGTAVLDLSAAWGIDEGGPEESVAASKQAAANKVADSRKKRATELAALLRETAQLLERDEALSDEAQHEKVMAALGRIRDTLIESTAESERQITVLANEVDADSQTIASIESAARRRGIGLKLTRKELFERYAELNQEIVQPLTVSSGVIEMLHSGQGGALTDAQRDMLQLAADSVSRVNQLVAYMNRIAGLPASYTPDMGIISETYR